MPQRGVCGGVRLKGGQAVEGCPKGQVIYDTTGGGGGAGARGRRGGVEWEERERACTRP